MVTGPPGDIAVTRPVLAFTLAIGLLFELHVIDRSVRTLPLPSFAVAVNCCVVPAVTLAEAGLTLTTATGTRVTVMSEVLDFPSLVAVMVAVPTATAVTSPFASTVAVALSEDHEMVRPLSAEPVESFVVAVSC